MLKFLALYSVLDGHMALAQAKASQNRGQRCTNPFGLVQEQGYTTEIVLGGGRVTWNSSSWNSATV